MLRFLTTRIVYVVGTLYLNNNKAQLEYTSFEQ